MAADTLTSLGILVVSIFCTWQLIAWDRRQETRRLKELDDEIAEIRKRKTNE